MGPELFLTGVQRPGRCKAPFTFVSKFPSSLPLVNTLSHVMLTTTWWIIYFVFAAYG